MYFIRKITEGGDWVLVGTTTVLVLLGLVILSSASSALAFLKFDDSFHFVKQQGVYALLGVVVLVFFMMLDYHKLRPFAFILWVLSLLLLIAVFIPGIGAIRNDVRSWIELGFLSFQPVEFVKLFLIIYLATWFSDISPKSLRSAREVLYPFLFVTGVLLVLILRQPDFGSMVLLFMIALTMYFVAGARIRHLFYITFGTIVLLPMLIVFEPYRFSRLTAFINPTGDLSGAGYHLHQALIAISSGGWMGKGYGESLQKFQYLPEAAGDSIFAVVAEELGFFVSAFIILLFIVLLFRGLRIASSAPDMFGKLLAVGISAWIALQSFLNIGAIIGLLPITGLPLPFISQGGTALVTLLAGVGIMFNISGQRLRPMMR